ncbi:hypothetical protein CUMW_121650 [Citrus unshiu]|uniref:Uncharacterized protein n=1 Tax=Citrus sinensis TaxID=2711 RepID=A0A067DB86_CITSI|nr:hypothetical protein CISIN_1g034936mg [Citrus sinensis]GAY49774.1 hypothetical protein CUMW_121650 [Citrus unshiu]
MANFSFLAGLISSGASSLLLPSSLMFSVLPKLKVPSELDTPSLLILFDLLSLDEEETSTVILLGSFLILDVPIFSKGI